MGPLPPVALPPVTVDYAHTLQPVTPGAPPSTSQYTYTRASDGQVRVDSGTMSVITNPATAQTILLDHVKKTASIQPTPPPAPTAPPPPAMPQMPGMPKLALPGMPKPPALPPVEDLGKRLFQGHEVVGTRSVAQPPPLPTPPAFKMPDIAKLPAMQMPGAPKPPQVPGAPPLPGAPAMQIPGMPKPPALTVPGMPKAPPVPGMPPAPPMPGAPPLPTTPQPPITTEVWTSTKLSVPMIAKINGGFGQITQVCKSAVPGEPHPSAFQIPPGYKMI